VAEREFVGVVVAVGVLVPEELRVVELVAFAVADWVLAGVLAAEREVVGVAVVVDVLAPEELEVMELVAVIAAD